jgi:hypothetical protein
MIIQFKTYLKKILKKFKKDTKNLKKFNKKNHSIIEGSIGFKEKDTLNRFGSIGRLNENEINLNVNNNEIESINIKPKNTKLIKKTTEDQNSKTLAESARRNNGMPWIGKDIDLKKNATLIQSWIINKTIKRVQDDGWTVLWATYDERFVPNMVLIRKNILMAVYVHTIWNHKDFTKINDDIINRLLSWSLDNDAIPIICNMGIIGTLNEQPKTIESLNFSGLNVVMEDNYLFYDCILRKPWSPINYNPNLKKEISLWEMYEISIRIISNQLNKEGFIIEKWNPDPTQSPQIWAKQNGKKYNILVIPQLYMTHKNISRELVNHALLYSSQNGSQLMIFKVTLASSKSTLVSENTEIINREDEIDFKIEEININEASK